MLDLRQFPAPEPLLRTLAASAALPSGASLEVLTPPLPVLVELLGVQGLEVAVERLRDGSTHLRVHRP